VSERGTTLREVEAPLTRHRENARAQAKRKKEEERIAIEESARTALLDITERQDIDVMRDRCWRISRAPTAALERYRRR